jgi:hypothetical protein
LKIGIQNQATGIGIRNRNSEFGNWNSENSNWISALHSEDGDSGVENRKSGLGNETPTNRDGGMKKDNRIRNAGIGISGIGIRDFRAFTAALHATRCGIDRKCQCKKSAKLDKNKSGWLQNRLNFAENSKCKKDEFTNGLINLLYLESALIHFHFHACRPPAQ